MFASFRFGPTSSRLRPSRPFCSVRTRCALSSPAAPSSRGRSSGCGLPGRTTHVRSSTLRLSPEDEVGAQDRQADVAEFAYRDVFSSAALLFALSHYLPVVAPGGGTATEMVRAPGVEAYGEGWLATELERIRHGYTDNRRPATIVVAEACPWSLVGAETADVCRKVIGVGAGARGG